MANLVPSAVPSGFGDDCTGSMALRDTVTTR